MSEMALAKYLRDGAGAATVSGRLQHTLKRA
jgi:hypothetical protein